MKPGLTRRRIAVAALALLDEGGRDRLTMRELGRSLGVDPMAVYRHVKDKSALVDLVVDEVLGEARAALPPASDSWRSRVLDLLETVLGALTRHPGVAAVLAGQPPLGPAALDLFAELVSALRRSGAPEHDVVHAAQAVVTLTFAGSLPVRRPGTPEAQARVRAVRSAMRDAGSPSLEHVPDHLAEVVPVIAGVDLLLDGLATRATPGNGERGDQ